MCYGCPALRVSEAEYEWSFFGIFFPLCVPLYTFVLSLCSLLGGTKSRAKYPCGVYNRRDQVNVSPVAGSIYLTIQTYPFPM